MTTGVWKVKFFTNRSRLMLAQEINTWLEKNNIFYFETEMDTDDKIITVAIWYRE